MRSHSTPRLLALLVGLPAFIQPSTHFAAAPKAPETSKISIRVISGAVRYETTRFDVTAGGAVELTLINDCILPHNLVILRPEAEPALIAAVNTMGLEGMEKNFVPSVPGIVAATKLLQPTKKELLSFTAPQEEGDYPYLCTFPGHWFTMRGVMRVKAAGAKLEAAQKSTETITQVQEDALKNSGMTHKPLGTFEKPFVMRTFAPDPGLDAAVFAHHGVGKNAVKYDPATRMDLSKKETDPATGVEREVPIVVKAEKGVAGAIAVNVGFYGMPASLCLARRLPRHEHVLGQGTRQRTPKNVHPPHHGTSGLQSLRPYAIGRKLRSRSDLFRIQNGRWSAGISLPAWNQNPSRKSTTLCKGRL